MLKQNVKRNVCICTISAVYEDVNWFYLLHLSCWVSQVLRFGKSEIAFMSLKHIYILCFS